MEDLYKQLKERLQLIEAMYDNIRIVDPLNKQTIIFKHKEIKSIKGTCYDYWEKGESCSNCISRRAYIEKDTFVKIEYVHSKVVLVISTPVYIEERMYIIEVLKDISQSGIIFDVNNDANIAVVINKVNEKAVCAELASNYNGTLIKDKFLNRDENKLSVLNSKIQELRDILNDMCASSDEKVEDKQKLIVSQYLDELIVEYMRNSIQLN